jgi:hypothetical protein
MPMLTEAASFAKMAFLCVALRIDNLNNNKFLYIYKKRMKEIREAKAAINTNNIILAGKALKTVVFTILIMIGFEVILFLSIKIPNAQEINNIAKYIEELMVLLKTIGLVSLVGFIIILISLYNAGDKLVNVLKENLSEPKSTMLDELLQSDHETIEQTSESGDTLNDTSLK